MEGKINNAFHSTNISSMLVILSLALLYKIVFKSNLSNNIFCNGRSSGLFKGCKSVTSSPHIYKANRKLKHNLESVFLWIPQHIALSQTRSSIFLIFLIKLSYKSAKVGKSKFNLSWNSGFTHIHYWVQLFCFYLPYYLSLVMVSVNSGRIQYS